MSVRRSTISSLVVLALVSGTAVAGTMTARAATTACGAGCMALANLDFGTSDLTAVHGGDASVRAPVFLSAAAPVAAEDWQVTDLGSVSALYPQGLVPAEVNTLFPGYEGAEFQYTPDGVASVLCLGLRTAARQNERVRLELCGAGPDTVWVVDQGDHEGRYAPMVAGSDTDPTPLVLTGGQTGRALTVQAMSGTNGIVSADQVWQAVYGVQS